MKKLFIMAIATVLFASCNKHNSSSSEVLYKDSSISGTSYNSAMNYNNFSQVYSYDDKVYPSDLTEENLEESSSLNDYSIHCDGSKDFTITDTNGNYYHVSVDEYGNVTSTTVIQVPKCCGCFNMSVEYVSGLVEDPTGTPAPLITVQNGNLTIDGKVA
jgi:hypothetical protein